LGCFAETGCRQAVGKRCLPAACDDAEGIVNMLKLREIVLYIS
jgi:hypothetical protein